MADCHGLTVLVSYNELLTGPQIFFAPVLQSVLPPHRDLLCQEVDPANQIAVIANRTLN